MAVCIDVSASWRQVAGKLKVKTILQVSKIAAFVLTKRQINIKKDVSREKIFASVDFCLYFCAIQKTHIVNTIGYLF